VQRHLDHVYGIVQAILHPNEQRKSFHKKVLPHLGDAALKEHWQVALVLLGSGQ
jgi:hypothetical protein